jgi:hypothetical protein
MYKVTKTSFELPQHLGKLRRSPRSPRLPRCCQSPKVTSLDLHLSRIQPPRMDAQIYSSSISSKLAVGDQPMISLNYIGLTDEHYRLESRKMLSVRMDRCFQLFIISLTGEHILSHSVNVNAPV